MMVKTTPGTYVVSTGGTLVPTVKAVEIARSTTHVNDRVRLTLRHSFTFFPCPYEVNDMLTTASTNEVKDAVTCPRHLILHRIMPLSLWDTRPATQLSSLGSANALRRFPEQMRLTGLTRTSALSSMLEATRLCSAPTRWTP